MLSRTTFLTLCPAFFLAIPAMASTYSCFDPSTDPKGTTATVALNYDMDSSVGELQAYGTDYDNTALVFSPTGRLTHAYVKGEVDFRIQSFVPTAGGLIFAKLTFSKLAASELKGQSRELLCRKS